MMAILRLVAPVVLTLGILGAAWQLQLLPLNAVSEEAPAETGESATFTYRLNERVVNLADGPAFRYLKVQVALEFDDPAHRAGELRGEALLAREEELRHKIDVHVPAIDDLLTTTLTRKTSAELLTPEGKETLRQELLDGIRQRVHDPRLRSVYLVQFVIQ